MLVIAAQPMNKPNLDAYQGHTRINVGKRVVKSVQLAITAMKVMDQRFLNQKNVPKAIIVQIYLLNLLKIQI